MSSFPAGAAAPSPPEPGPLNRLAKEKSPYLLQHADNPVDWYPWGEEAFAKARADNKLIFLSIGYSTCHWCHVMAHESFSNPQLARIMNEHFVNIKLDREERPDVDQVYMAFVQASTGAGGWPLSAWLTPDLKPFVGGTYFPPEDNYGRPGFKSVLERLAAAWLQDEAEIRALSATITEQLRDAGHSGGPPAAVLPDPAVLQTAYRQLASAYDPKDGGFGGAPKFPRPVTLNFLHACAALDATPPQDREQALAISAQTLRKMADGGINDHLGGGFHRYSVDRYWHIPHYEKMLYDQAQLVTACLDAARLTKDPFHHQTARDILAYVTRAMTHPGGGYYSAEDADSLKSPSAGHKTEGAFYIWEKSEIDHLLGDQAALFNAVYGVKPQGNAPEGSDPHGELTGTNTLIRRLDDTAAAARFNLDPSQVTTELAHCREILFTARDQRPHPHLDDKILTAWNGLMISAFARAAQQLGDPAYLASASHAAVFIKTHLYDATRGVLLRSYRDGSATIDGFAADYAFLIQGLLDLYQAGFDVAWLQWADALQTKQDELFWDPEAGGYFASTGTDPHVLLRRKEAYDGAEPSENSIATGNLLRLAAILDQPERAAKAAATLRAFASQIESDPTSCPQLLVGLAAVRAKPAQVVIAGQAGAADTLALLNIARRHARPHQLILLADGGAGQEFLGQHATFYQTVRAIDGNATAYVCENYSCQLPTQDPEQLKQLLSHD